MQCNKTAPARRLFFTSAPNHPVQRREIRSAGRIIAAPVAATPLRPPRGDPFRLRILGETLNQAFCGNNGQLTIFRTQLMPEALRIDRYV